MGTKKGINKILKSYKLFGISVYEKKRLSEEKLQLNFEAVHCDDIGLYVITKYPRLKYSNLSSREDFNWKWHAITTIRLTILNLINNGVVEIIKVKDSSSYFFNVFKSISYDYYFEVTDLQIDEDWFSSLVYKKINEVNRLKHYDLFQYVSAIISIVLQNHATYKNPSRAFLINLMKQYVKKFKWLEFDKSEKFYGFVEDNNLKVSEIYIPRLNMQHKSLSDIDSNLYHSYIEYALFCQRLEQEIKNDFERRKPNNG